MGSLFGRNPKSRSGWNTTLTNGIKCSSHAYESAKIVAWITETFRRSSFTCVPYMESLLSGCLHWVNPTNAEEMETVFFRTTIPDSWMILPALGAFRVEVQLTRASLDKFEQVINDMSHDDHILYVVQSESLAKVIRKIEGTRTFTVIEQGNGAQLAAWASEFVVWKRAMGPSINPLVANYGSEYFRSLLLKNAGFISPAPPAASQTPPSTR
jgi:hypothetical protein